MKRPLCLFLLLILSLNFFCACADTAQDVGKPVIVSSVFPAYDFARALMGDTADVKLLLPPGADLHSYEPTPQDVAMIESCDLFLYIGGDGDENIRTLLSRESEEKSFSFFDALGITEEAHEEGIDHDHADEHLWTSPQKALRMVSALADRLCALFPREASAIRERQKTYEKELSALDADYAAFAAASPFLPFADRFPFAPLCEDYAIAAQSALSGCGEDSEPSAADLASLIDTVREKAIPVVFYTETSDGRIARTVQAETGAEPVRLHSCHNLSAEDRKQNCTYLSLMRENLDAMKQVLGK